MVYKLMKGGLCEDEFVQLNFQLVDNARQKKLNFVKIQRYDVGKNILLNRQKNWQILAKFEPGLFQSKMQRTLS